ncbi:ABC transporter substrate-binding protein [Niveibacterium umoris]|nr:transporter substrate-binding domain-containing protein [Niveibacterium umoris]
MRLIASLLLLVVSLSSRAALGQPLHVAVSEGWNMPFARFVRDAGGTRLEAGVIHDWYRALAAELGRPIDFTVLPPMRVDLLVRDEQIDLRCFSSPEWENKDLLQAYQWSDQQILSVEERLVGGPRAATVKRLEDLAGQSIGTVIGYRYPLLEPLFRQQRITREDAPSEAVMLEKQLLGRSDYSVVRALTLEYLQSQDPKWLGLQTSPLVVSSTPLYCLLRRGSGISMAQFDAALANLRRRGTMQQLLERYRLQ